MLVFQEDKKGKIDGQRDGKVVLEEIEGEGEIERLIEGKRYERPEMVRSSIGDQIIGSETDRDGQRERNIGFSQVLEEEGRESLQYRWEWMYRW